MATPAVIKATDVVSYITEVSNLVGAAGRALWYRGVGNSTKHTLRPGLYRDDTRQNPTQLLELERKMISHFRRQSALSDAPKAVLDLEMLFFMQHHGVKTRLLDWTVIPFIGLYFAMEAAQWDTSTASYPDDAAVWVLDPVTWNSHAWKDFGYKGDIFDPVDDQIKGYAPPKTSAVSDLMAVVENPGAMTGTANSRRLIAQSGVFTIFGRKVAPMEQQFATDSYPVGSLTKIEIPSASIGDVKIQLRNLGMSETVAFPDLDGVAREVNREAGFNV